jgi:hypothetical protein
LQINGLCDEKSFDEDRIREVGLALIEEAQELTNIFGAIFRKSG